MKDIQQNHDGYHTFAELYEHRHLLFLNLIVNNKSAWKSELHADGTMFDDMFIAGMRNINGEMITYHLPKKYWLLCKAEIIDKAPEWDGHTEEDVRNRLLRNL